MSNTQTVLAALDRIKQQLQRRGGSGIRGLGRTFRAMDSFDGNKQVDASEFEVGLRENGVDLTNQERAALFTYFDKNGDGTIDFDEFLVGVRGQLNPRRKAMVDKAFLKFDRDGNGYIDVLDLRGVYNCSFHPKVRSGEISEDQALIEFLQNFNDKNRDGRITKDEWDEYYSAVSASIDNDEHFVLLMKNAWRLD